MSTDSALAMTFERPPAFGAMYWRMISRKRPGIKPGERLPGLSARWAGAPIDAAHLASYRTACGLPASGALPILYPHVLAGSLHLALMSDPRFPLSMLGAVHTRNHILQRRALPTSGTLDISCGIAAQRPVKAGLEFDLATRIAVGGETPWESVSVYLVRGKRFGEPGETPASAKFADLGMVGREASWAVPKDMGRRYAAICGDRNPIHVSVIGAKLFGFPRPIAHGMWSAGRCMAELPGVGEGAQRLDLGFKGPIFLGAKSTLKMEISPDAVRFDCFCQGNDRPCISGLFRGASPDEPLI